MLKTTVDDAAPARDVRGGTLQVLTDTFARVLQRPGVAPDDDFFDLGGDSIMAVALTAEIEEATGMRLPTTALFDAPTAAALARVIEQETGVVPSSIAQLRPGGDAPALFLAPGVSGSAIDLLPLARLIETDSAVYGLRAPGYGEGETPLDRIEPMARHYLPLIRAVQPSGPYRLAGYSMGGLTALEMARLLIEEGEQVALVAMLDTILHPKDLPLATKARIWARRARHHAGQLSALRAREVPGYLAGRVKGMLTDLGAHAEVAREQRENRNRSIPEASWRVIEAGFVASSHYRQRFFPGTITFIQAIGNDEVPAHPDIVWRGQSQRLDLHEVSGGHLDMIGENVDGLAAALSGCLRTAGGAA